MTQRANSVQQKISCLFETMVVTEKSSKRDHQPFKVVASDRLKEAALASDVHGALASEKIDGTCVYVGPYHGRPWLWARHDRKPNKSAEKKFKKHQASVKQWELSGKPDGHCPGDFAWDPAQDFKPVPSDWIPAKGVEVADGVPQPDAQGHIPGWVPVSMKSRQHCWHLAPVMLEPGLALVLRPEPGAEKMTYEVGICYLADLSECTLELIGTNINGNPYHLGSKTAPLHLLTPHGAIRFQTPPPLDYEGMRAWFTDDECGQVEGVVWHCSDGCSFKVHRHHLELKWPLDDLRLTSRPVKVNVDLDLHPDVDFEETSLFVQLSQLNGKVFSSLSDITLSSLT